MRGEGDVITVTPARCLLCALEPRPAHLQHQPQEQRHMDACSPTSGGSQHANCLQTGSQCRFRDKNSTHTRNDNCCNQSIQRPFRRGGAQLTICILFALAQGERERARPARSERAGVSNSPCLPSYERTCWWRRSPLHELLPTATNQTTNAHLQAKKAKAN